MDDSATHSAAESAAGAGGSLPLRAFGGAAAVVDKAHGGRAGEVVGGGGGGKVEEVVVQAFQGAIGVAMGWMPLGRPGGVENMPWSV